MPDDPGEIIDAEVVSDKKSRLKSNGGGQLMDRDAKSGMPNIDEWMHFFSRVVMRVATDYYIDLAFRGIDEDWLSPNEVDRINLSDEERDRMARPFAEYSNKSKFMRKHGRMIISSADSIDAILQIGMWVARVNRIAAKYKRIGGVSRKPRVVHTRAAPVFRPEPDINYQQEAEDNGSFGSPEPSQNGNGPHWRPGIGGTVINPNLG